MASVTSTVTSKWQITIPEDVRKQIALQVGQRIAWEVEGDKIVGRKVRTLSELAGCLSSASNTVAESEIKGAFTKAATARHERISKTKP